MFLQCSRAQLLLLATGFIFISAIVSGYLLSDDFFFNQMIRSRHINTPEEAFYYVENNIRPPTEGLQPIPGLTPRYMLTKRKYLYCDEGAIVLATIVHELGYKTRLVDLVGDDGVSHHTILEVFQDGAWKTYDTLQKLAGRDLSTKRQVQRSTCLPAIPEALQLACTKQFLRKALRPLVKRGPRIERQEVRQPAGAEEFQPGTKPIVSGGTNS